MKVLPLEERLIMALDLEPQSALCEPLSMPRAAIKELRLRATDIVKSVRDTGIIVKVNSLLRACGVDLIESFHELGVRVMADYKLVDIPHTLETDAKIIRLFKPELLTVMCCAGIEGIRSVQEFMPETEVLGVTVLTSLGEEECQAIFTCSTKAGALRFAQMAQLGGLRGLISSAQELDLLTRRRELVMSFNTPGIRPLWSVVIKDDQEKSRVMTPRKAILAGADRVVVGRPIIDAKPNSDGKPQSPNEAVAWILKEIEEALVARDK